MNESRADEFLTAMAAWLRARGFQAAGHWHDVDVRRDVIITEVAARAAKLLVRALLAGADGGAPVAGGAKAEQVAAAMEPFVPLADMVAVQLPGMSASKSNSLIAVILADGLPPEEITSRFPEMMTHAPAVARLGMRVAFQHLGIMVHPLVVFSNSREYARTARDVLKRGWEVWALKKISLKAAVIDLEGGRVDWAEKTGLARIGSMLGVKHEPFSERDLQQSLRELSPPAP